MTILENKGKPLYLCDFVLLQKEFIYYSKLGIKSILKISSFVELYNIFYMSYNYQLFIRNIKYSQKN